jgi:hypothetical protein
MPVGGLLEGIPNTQNQVFLKGFVLDGQANIEALTVSTRRAGSIVVG